VSERHHQQQQRSEADSRARRLRQEVDELDVYNMDRLQVESEALDLRMDISPHLRMSSSPLLPKTAPPAGPLPVRVLLEERPRPVRDHLDSLIIPTTGVDTPLGLMLNPIQSHLKSLVQAEAGAQLPPFCLVSQDLPPMSLERIRVVAGSAGPSSIGKPSAQSGTKPLPILAGRLRERRLREIQEGILQHNQECRDVQERLNRERQRLHRVAVRYGPSTNLWTAIILIFPILLHEAGQAGGFLVYDCSHNQLKRQTIDLTAPKDCKDPLTVYCPARMTKIKIIMTDGDRPVMATQCLVLKTQEVVRCGGHPSFHYGSVKIAINQPLEVTPQECRDALIAGKISVQGQKMNFKISVSHYHRYYSEGGRAVNGDCAITTFTRKGVTYKKSYEETTIKVHITKVRGLKSDNTIRFPSGLIASHADGVVRDVHDGMLVWST
jgi:hypothetical protein